MLLADDHAETAEQLRALLQARFDVVEVVGDGNALVSAAARHAPDAIVTDIAMPVCDGIEACGLIRRDNPRACIVFVTVHSEPMLVERGLAAGALGYVLKDAAGDDLVAALEAALDGKRYLSRGLRH